MAGRSTRRARATIHDVARVAEVSLTTVSDVVNGKGRVDPRTRERVLAAVAKVDWRPRHSARALRSGRSGVFALCLPRRNDSVDDWLLNADYDMALVAACAAATVDSDRQLLLAPRPRDINDLGRLDVDGVIIADPREGDPALDVLDAAGIPTVTIDRGVRTDGWSAETDTAGSTVKLLDHLAAQGSSQIAMITSDARWAWFENTSVAYEKWCDERGVRPQVRLVNVDRPRTSAATAVRSLLRLKSPPDAILTVPQGAALGALDAIAASGRSVPDDLLLAAAMDGQLLQVASPPITAVDLRPVDMAHAAIELLGRRVAGEPADGPTVVETELRVRASSSRA